MRRRRSPPVTDGGSPGASLFRSLERPVVAYAIGPEPTVRAVNPAFEAAEGTDTVEPGVALDTALSAIGIESGVATEICRAAAAGESVERTAAIDTGVDERVSVVVVPSRTDAVDAPEGGGYVVVEEAAADARAERLETFARVVSHDLRNPLDVARIRLDAAEETGEAVHFEKVRNAHERIERIARDVLLLTDPEATVDASPIDLEAVVEAAWETVDTGRSSLEVETLPRIEADAGHLQRLFENLFRNAVEHGSTNPRPSSTREDAVEHGSTSPPSQAQEDAAEHGSTNPRSRDEERTSREVSPSVTVTVGPSDDGFYVADDGPGIPTDVRERVFEPGESTNEGSGLGLAVVRRIATAHGWAVCPGESDAGGARFTFAGVETVEDSS